MRKSAFSVVRAHTITVCVLLSTAFGLASPFASAATAYNPPDLIGTWRYYSYWDGDFNDPGWTRGVLTVDGDGEATATEVDSEGTAGTASAWLTLSSSGAVTVEGPWSTGITSSRYQMDSGKTVVAGVSTEIDGGFNYRNFEVALKQGSGFTTAAIAGTWDWILFSDTKAFNEPLWARLTLTFNNAGTITSGSFTASDGSSGPLAGSASVSSNGRVTLLGAWAAGVTDANIFLDADGTVLAGVYIEPDDEEDYEYANFLMGVKRSGTYLQSDFAGDWDLCSFFDSVESNEAGTSRGPFTVSASGGVNGLATDFDGATVPVSGTATVNSAGIVSLGGSWVADFSNDRFSMDAGQTVFIGTATVEGTGRDMILAVDAPPFDKRLSFGNPGSNQTQQSFLRVVNKSSASGLVTLHAIDDNGEPAPGGDLSFTLGPKESKNFNSMDYEEGNTTKGLTGAFGNGSGKWQFLISSFLDLETSSNVRTPDGFLTNLTDIVPSPAPNVYEIYFANPGSNLLQQSFLRFVNKSDATGTVTITGRDDNGDAAPGGALSFTLGPNQSKNFNSLDYELGNTGKGLSGALGDGAGKWRLTVTSTLDLEVMSLIRSSDGFVTNLSGQVPRDEAGAHRIDFANPGSNLGQQSFIRVVNTSNAVGTVTVSGIDDTGTVAPGGDVQFTLGPFESKNVNAVDLEDGNETKGLTGALGDGSGRWQLTVTSSLALRVMNLVRTSDGFVTNLSRVAPRSTWLTEEAWFFNPGSNTSQRSFLRLVNRSSETADIEISGIDDKGNAAPGGTVELSIAPNAAREITAADLEDGNAAAGLVGALGNGAGKWRLTVASDQDVVVMSLLETAGGFLTNQSRVIP